MTKFVTSSWQRIFGCFMAGLLAVLPVVLTVAIVAWVTRFLADMLGPGTMAGRMLASLGMRFGSEGLISYLLGLAVVLFALFALGVLMEWGAKRFVHNTLDYFLKKAPLVGSLYGSLKQLVGMFDRTEPTKLKAMSVVFCYFGGKGSAGVLALMPSSETIEIEGQPFHVVMIPTAPVPFGGGLIFVPAEMVKPVEMSVDNFVGVYVSMGVSTPEYMKSLL